MKRLKYLPLGIIFLLSLGSHCYSSASELIKAKQDSLFLINLDSITDNTLDSLLVDYQFYKSSFRNIEQRKEILNLLTIKLKLDECERLFKIGKTSEAQTILNEIIDMDPQKYNIIQRINDIRKSRKVSFWAKMYDRYIQSFYTALFLLVLTLFIYVLIKSWKWFRVKYLKRKWSIEILPNSYSVITTLLVESLQNYGQNLRHLSSGLHSIGTDKLAIIPVNLNEGSFSMTENLDEEISFAVSVVNSLFNLKIQDTALSGIISRLIRPKKKVLKISIEERSEKLIFVNLNSVDKRGKFVNINTEFNIDDDISDIRNKLNEISFKMLFTLKIPDSNPNQAESANLVRKGLDSLKMYSNASVKEDGSDNKNYLDEALKYLEKAKQQSRNNIDAIIYEGVCLDLKEMHDKAIEKFDFLLNKKKNLNIETQDRIKYFKAVSLFRKYNYKDREEALEIIDGIIDDLPHLHSEFIALCYIVKANIIAHKFIQWQRHIYNGNKSYEIYEVLKRKMDSSKVLQSWIENVKTITDYFENDLPDTWDAYVKDQIKWGRLNALGNTYLTYYYSFIIIEPQILTDKEILKQKVEHLNKALESFNECIYYLKPGVETLTNIATVYMYLGRYDDCREYCENALKINISYEYAKFRICKSYDLQIEEKEDEQEKKELIEKLSNKMKTEGWCNDHLNIEEFRNLCAKYRAI